MNTFCMVIHYTSLSQSVWAQYLLFVKIYTYLRSSIYIVHPHKIQRCVKKRALTIHMDKSLTDL